jgi:predicted nucleic acid-binding Zn ribbon protein
MGRLSMKRLSSVLLSLPLRRYSFLPIIWKKVVGDDVAKFAHISYYKDGVLYVNVPAGVWATELSAYSSEIIERLKKEADIPVNEIKFRVYSFDIRSEKDLDLDDLTEEDRRYINSIVSNVKYPQIREAIFKIIGYHILRKRKGL